MAKSVSFSLTFMIEWKVKNIFSEDKQESEEFKFQRSWWKFVLNKVTLEGTERITINLKETVDGEWDDFTSHVFIVDKNHMRQVLTKLLCEPMDMLYYKCVWWMDVEDLRQREDILSTNGVVSFVCILTPEPTSEDDDEGKELLQVSTDAKAKSSVETLLLDFRRLLDDSALSDVTLKCGDRTIPAHRNILSARSDVFAAMLRSDMTESQSGVIEISDMDPPVLEQLLQFIYSCKLPDMSMDTTPQLYEAADKYGVVSLMKDCSSFMTENITEETACSILLLADVHSDKDLEERALSFIMKTQLFLKDDIWLEFCRNHPELAVKVLNRYCKICCA